MTYLSPTNRRPHDLPADPTPQQLADIRAEHIARMDAAADRAQRLGPVSGWPRGCPHKLSEVGIWLASHGFTDEPCAGERYFGLSFASYCALMPVAVSLSRAGERLVRMEHAHACNRTLAHAAIDRGMAPLNARQQARWDAEGVAA